MKALDAGTVAGLPPKERRIAATILLLMALCLAGFGMASGPAGAGTSSGDMPGDGYTDYRFYQDVATDVRRGEPYDHAAVRELHDHGLAMKPFYVVRPPLLAWLTAWIEPDVLQMLHVTLGVLSVGAWAIRLRSLSGSIVFKVSCIVALLVGWWDLADVGLVPLHETWSGMAMLLSLALRTEKRIVGALAAACLACAFRELAVLLPMAMLLCALQERRRSEAIAWTGCLAAIASGYAIHAIAIDNAIARIGYNHAGDLGGLGAEGVGFVLRAAMYTSGLDMVSPWLGCLIAGLGIIGWLARPEPLCRRTTLLLMFWIVLMSIRARHVNYYWAAMYAPLLPVGAIFGVRAVSEIFRKTGPEGFIEEPTRYC